MSNKLAVQINKNIDSLSQIRIPIEDLLDAIKGNQRITELTVRKRWIFIPVDSALAQRFASEHPALIDLDLFGYQFTASDARAMLLHQLKSLQKICFSMLRSELSQLQSQLQEDEE